MQRGGGSLTSIDPFCYMKTSHTRGLNNSELNFCICLSFLSVANLKVQMYRVYYRIVFKRSCTSASTHNEACHRCSLLACADKGMITPEDLPHFVNGQHNRVDSLAFLLSNNSILTCLFHLWLSLVEKMFGFLAFLSNGRNVVFRYRFFNNLIRKKKFQP